MNFDQLPGATDDQKMAAFNAQVLAWAKAGGVMPPVVVSRRIRTTTPIVLRSSLQLVSDGGAPSREFGRRPGIKWLGAPGSSLFVWPSDGQFNQGYPSDGSPRDGAVIGLEFVGRPGTHFMPKGNPGDYRGKTLWYWTFRDCGWKGFVTVWWGASTGSSICGITHLQGITDTAFWLGGSETTLFGEDGHSFADGYVPGKPMIRSNLSKSVIGRVMLTARQDQYGVLIDGGHNTRVSCQIDAQDSDPMWGPGLRVTGGLGHVFTGMSLKGIGARGAGQGWIEVLGGSQHHIFGNTFHRGGSSPAPEDFPVVYLGGSASKIKFGVQSYSGWPAQAVFRENVARCSHFAGDEAALRYVRG